MNAVRAASGDADYTLPTRSERMNTPPAMLHPELLAPDGGDTIVRDGRRLDHAEAASKPLRSRPEPQPRGAKVHGNRPIDQAEAAARFIAAPEHEKMHDERLWDLRQKRDREMHGIAEWEELRSLASAIKEHTLTHLDEYLEQFEANARSNGINVHWARDAAEHNRIVHGILSDHAAKSLIKSKSMLTEECGFRHYMASVGVEVVETDLGERIQQLDNEDPSHVVVPAVHKLRTDVAEVFAKTIGTDPANSDVHYLAEAQREATRPLILNADAGMTGCNFVVAETGTFVVCTNEGNADLSANVPKLHIASIGIEKIIPRLEHLAVFIRLLSRSALGSPVTQYTSHFRGPRSGGEMHVVLVDNGRSERLGLEEFWTSLKCIRCGACMNTCPVYRRSGGLSYGATYSGPIGLIIDPTFNQRKYSNLPFASTLNGSCTNVCPVKINIHEQIYAWRRVLVERHETPLAKRAEMKAAGELLSRPAAYRAAIAAADIALAHLPRFVIYNGLNAWGGTARCRTRPNRPFTAGTKPIAERENEQPRRYPGIDPGEPPPSGPAAARCPAVRRQPAGFAARGVQEEFAPDGRHLPRSAASGDALAPVREKIAGAKIVCSTVSEIAGNRDIASVGAPQDLADVDFAIVRASFAVAETGSVLLSEADLHINAVAYLAQHLIVLLDPADIVVNLHHAYRRPEFRDRHYASFHTGPSATADIEGVLIHGAQGVRSLSVLPLARSAGSQPRSQRGPS